MKNSRVSVTPEVLARFNKQNPEIMDAIEIENGVMYLYSAILDELYIPYIYSDDMTVARPKEVLRIITENSIELKNHFDLFKRMLTEISDHFYFQDVAPDNKYAELQTPSIVIEFSVKNCEQDTDADFIINNTQDFNYDYFQLKKAGLKAQKKIVEITEEDEI